MTPRKAILALLADLRHQQGRRLAAAIGLQLAGSFADGFGILMLIPLVAALGEQGGLLARLPGGTLFAGLGEGQRLLLASGLFLSAMAARSLLVTARDRTFARLTADYLASLKGRTLAGLAARGWRAASHTAQSDMQRLLLAGSDRIGSVLYFLQAIATNLLMLAVQGLLALALSPRLTLAAAALLLLAAALAWPWVRRTQRQGREIGAALQEAGDTGFLLHAGLKTALAQGEADRFVADYRDSEARLADAWARLSVVETRTGVVTSLVTALGAVALLCAGRLWLDLPLELLLPMLLLFGRLSGPAQSAIGAIQAVLAHGPSFADFQPFLAAPPRASAPPAPAAPLDWQRLDAPGLIVSPDGDHRLGPFDVHLPRGAWLAITGPSGSGKTSLVDTLAGLIPPMAGTIAIDGQVEPLGDRPEWGAGLAYVGQQQPLFEETLRGALGTAATAPDLDRLFVLAGLDALVARLPDGLDTRLGDRAARLSGGERQRVALVRALARRPRLLILDEATSALDSDSETRLLSRLRALDPRPALLFVSHRPLPDGLFDQRLDTTPSDPPA